MRNMERLTKRNEDNTAYYYPKCFKECDGIGYNHKCDNCNLLNEVCERLGKYEDLEEQGKLWKLPCAPGQPVWKIKNGKIQKWFVGTIKIEGSGVSFCNVVYICDISDFGKTVFFTREEAEAALKRMEV